jgi:hypothetical protein
MVQNRRSVRSIAYSFKGTAMTGLGPALHRLGVVQGQTIYQRRFLRRNCSRAAGDAKELLGANDRRSSRHRGKIADTFNEIVAANQRMRGSWSASVKLSGAKENPAARRVRSRQRLMGRHGRFGKYPDR